MLQAVFQPVDRSAGLLLFGALGVDRRCWSLETTGGLIVLEQRAGRRALRRGEDGGHGRSNPAVDDGPAWFKTFITVSMLVALVCEASFTAGLVNRLIDRRLTGIVGRRAVPRRDHVVVVGIGQVGLRLCTMLRRCGVGVVAVDDREEGENVGMARELGLPVVVGRGADLSLLRRLSLGRAVALAAVTADDLENISIAMAARAIAPDLRVVLRAGDGRLANETRSLFRIGGGPRRPPHRGGPAGRARDGIGGEERRLSRTTTRTCFTTTGRSSPLRCGLPRSVLPCVRLFPSRGLALLQEGAHALLRVVRAGVHHHDRLRQVVRGTARPCSIWA